MKGSADRPQHRWLAQALPDETIRIERMLFQVLRDLCSGLGVAEGDVVRCRTVSGTVVLLEDLGGRTIVIDQEWARFIEVRSADSAAPAPAFYRPPVPERSS
jgi:hypothetical protein